MKKYNFEWDGIFDWILKKDGKEAKADQFQIIKCK